MIREGSEGWPDDRSFGDDADDWGGCLRRVCWESPPRDVERAKDRLRAFAREEAEQGSFLARHPLALAALAFAAGVALSVPRTRALALAAAGVVRATLTKIREERLRSLR